MSTPLTPAPYRALLETHLRRNPHAGYVQLATVEDGRPRVRTVLFQGLCILYMNQQEHLGLCIKTSRASNKVQRAESDLTEICWWMEDTMVQFRIASGCGEVSGGRPKISSSSPPIRDSMTVHHPEGPSLPSRPPAPPPTRKRGWEGRRNRS